jgi:hypothetical protein
MGASSRDPIVGRGDWGPIYRSPTGKQYWFEEPREEGHSVIKALARHIASQPILDTAGDVVKALAQGAWDGISAPGRAAAGENVTLGDAWNTAGMVALGGAPMLAPEGALRAGALRTGGKADEILDMLKTGRAAEVTDDMMAAADPQRLWAGYDLPMDEASRMARAREMGFDTETPLYHGTDADFQAFDNGKIGTGSGAQAYGHGTYVSNKADVAEQYGDVSYPVLTRDGDVGVMDWTMPMAGQKPEIQSLVRTYAPNTPGMATGFDLMKSISGSNPTPYTSAADRAMATASDRLGSAGVSGVKFPDGAATNLVVFDPRNIRSRFARFDPRLKHLANLSAGVGGVAVMTDVDAEKAAIQAYLDKWQ